MGVGCLARFLSSVGVFAFAVRFVVLRMAVEDICVIPSDATLANQVVVPLLKALYWYVLLLFVTRFIFVQRLLLLKRHTLDLCQIYLHSSRELTPQLRHRLIPRHAVYRVTSNTQAERSLTFITCSFSISLTP